MYKKLEGERERKARYIDIPRVYSTGTELSEQILSISYHVQNHYNYTTTSASVVSSASDPSGRNGHSMYALVKALI